MAAYDEWRWNEIDEEKLVDLWRNHSCLYDRRNHEYNDRSRRAKAFRTMSAEIGKSGDKIKKRMESLRTSYSRLIKLPPPGPHQRAPSKRQKWIIDSLDFLRPFITTRAIPGDISGAFKYDEDDVINHTVSAIVGVEDDGDEIDEQVEDTEDLDASNDSNRASTKRPVTGMRRDNAEDLKRKTKQESLELTCSDDDEKRPLRRLSNKRSKTNKDHVESDDDEDESFVRHVLSSMRKMNEQNKAIFMHEVHNLLFRAKMDWLSDVLNSSSSQHPHPVYIHSAQTQSVTQSVDSLPTKSECRDLASYMNT